MIFFFMRKSSEAKFHNFPAGMSVVEKNQNSPLWLEGKKTKRLYDLWVDR